MTDAANSISSKQILLVEDDPAIAEPLIYALEREGWKVHWVTLAAQAQYDQKSRCVALLPRN